MGNWLDKPATTVYSPNRHGAARSYRCLLEAVLALRTAYQVEPTCERVPEEPRRMRISGERKYKHLDLDD